jgi:hypothetical protein
MDAARRDDGVVVDVVFEQGVLYLELANLSDRPALSVTCSFDPQLVDVEGRDVSKLRLFRRVEFLGPGRSIRTLLDSPAAFFARDAPERVTIAVEYERPDGPRETRAVTHDLGLFRELAFLT